MNPSFPATLFRSALFAGVFFAALVAQAQSPGESELAPSPQSAEQVAWLAKAKADYPMRTCVVSGEGLGGKMGGPVDFIYTQEGKPDRLVRLCCRSCVRDFKRSPQRFLAKLDAAAAAKAARTEQPD